MQFNKKKKQTPQVCFPPSSVGKNLPANAGDLDSSPGLGRSPGEGNGNPLQYSCLENAMDGGASWATVHGVTKSQTRLSEFTSSSLRLSQVSPAMVLTVTILPFCILKLYPIPFTVINAKSNATYSVY